MDESLSRRWIGLSLRQLELVLAGFGFVTAALAFAGTPGFHLAAAAAGLVVMLALNGVWFRVRQKRRRFSFCLNGALAGVGYIPPFSAARRSLLLMHVDEDEPNHELQLLYEKLLARQVGIRRLVVRRESSVSKWPRKSEHHPSLSQREILSEQAEMFRYCFAVVDDFEVLIAVPGFDSIDDETYSPKLILRHLIVIRDREIAAAFTRIHEQIWVRAKPEDPA